MEAGRRRGRTALPLTVEDLRESARQWLQLADDADLVPEALGLNTLMRRLDDGWDGNRLVEARLLLLLGRQAEAAELVSGVSDGLHSASGEGLVACAVRAAMGDEAAYRELTVATYAAVDDVQGWRPAYLLGAAASSRGDHAVADQVWLDVVIRRGIVTPFTATRFAVASVARRPAENAELAVAAVRDAVGGLSRLEPAVHEDPWPVYEAAGRLRERDDETGSRLLIAAAGWMFPRGPETRAWSDELGDADRGWAERVIWALTAAAEYMFGVRSAAVDRLRRRVPPRPGMTWLDSYVWRTVARAGPNSNPWIRTVGTYCGLGLAAGLATGFFAATIATVEIDDRLTSRSLEAVLIIAAWVGLCALLPAALAWLGDRWDRHDRHRSQRQRDEQERRDQRDGAGRCHCLQIRHLTGKQAELYLGHHLAPAPFDGPAATMVREVHPQAVVATCPTTGVAWLHLQLDRRRAPHLLRGTPATGTTPTRNSEGHGLYL